MNFRNQKQWIWWLVIGIMVAVVSLLHYNTPTMKWQYHLIYMQSYFIPILLAAFQFGVRGGLGTAAAVSLIYFPHIMLQWGGLVETNLMRYLQIGLFNIIGYLTGLKAQKEMEEKNRYQKTADELRESLELLKSQSEKLDEMEEQLRMADRLAVVGELTASLAHEVRNPLGSIQGTVEILRDELPLNEQNSEFFQILIEETNRLSSVVENYLGFSRKQRHEVSRFDIREITQNVRVLLENRARKEGVSIQVDQPESSIMLEADPNQLRQIFVNLVLNSLQAMEEGGKITLQARVEVNPEIREKFVDFPPHTDAVLVVSVKDEGPGIPPADLEKIFHPFYTTKANGTGLGLAIVKRTVERNRWQMEVHSQSGKGATFTIYIPISR